MKIEEKLISVRLACHQLGANLFENPAEVVGWMGAIQAQDYAMAKWAVGLRMKAGRLQQVNDALASGEIVRTHILRPTWHFVAGKDFRWMQRLSGERVRAIVDGWVKHNDPFGITEDEYTRSHDLLGKILSGRRHLKREEIGQELAAAGMPGGEEKVRRYLLRAEVEGIVCSGGDREGKPTYALVDEQVGPAEVWSEEEALGELAKRYFRSHSPATLNDFVWWSGLTVTKARQAIGVIGSGLLRERFDGEEYLVDVSCRPVRQRRSLHLLPAYDEYLISYKDRTLVLPRIHQPKAFNRWGIFYPVIAEEGRITGNWKRINRKGKPEFQAALFESGEMPETEKFQEAVNRYLAFTGKEKEE